MGYIIAGKEVEGFHIAMGRDQSGRRIARITLLNATALLYTNTSS